MFVLQDCSICFEDFDAQLIPHSISCGHVFCRPCLDSLVSSSPNCPNCRASFGRKAIRKVVCTFQDPPALDASTLSEAEMIMWQAIEGAVESVDGFEQRRSLVRDNSKLAARKAGFSRNMVIALDVMRLFVDVESKTRGPDYNMDSARAIEESLRDRISFLEAQLSGTRASFSTNIRDFQTMLLSKMQQLESSIWSPNEITPDTRHPPELSPARSVSGGTQVQSSTSQPTAPQPSANLAAVNSSTQGTVVEQHSTPSSSRTQPTTSTHVPTQQIAVATANYVTPYSDELCLTAGEILHLVEGKRVVVVENETFVFCRRSGGAGYAPKSHLNITNEM